MSLKPLRGRGWAARRLLLAWVPALGMAALAADVGAQAVAAPPPASAPATATANAPTAPSAAPAAVSNAPTAAASTAALAPSAARAGRSMRVVDHIAAIVNSELVTQLEVQQRADRAAQAIRRDGGTVPPAAALQQQALEALIDERVIVTQARELGMKIDEIELDRAETQIAQQNQLSLAQFRDRLKAEGLDAKRFRGTLRDQLLLERLRDREVPARIRTTDAEVDDMLEQRRRQSGAEPEINLAQLLITVPEGASAEVQAERRAKAEAALKRALAGEDFTKLARELSEDANREAGGEIGLKPASRLPDVFVEAVAQVGAGSVRPALVQTAAGFHVLKVLDKRQGAADELTQTRARHILLRAASAEPAAVQATVRRAEDLRRLIERGERSFEEVAREHSQDGSATAGGDLGWAAPGQFVPEFEEALNKLAPGAVSAPVVSRFGVHLIQVAQRRQVKVEPGVLREQALAAVREAKYDQAYADWIKELRLRAYIEVREPPQ